MQHVSKSTSWRVALSREDHDTRKLSTRAQIWRHVGGPAPRLPPPTQCLLRFCSPRHTMQLHLWYPTSATPLDGAPAAPCRCRLGSLGKPTRPRPCCRALLDLFQRLERLLPLRFVPAQLCGLASHMQESKHDISTQLLPITTSLTLTSIIPKTNIHRGRAHCWWAGRDPPVWT